MDDLAKARLLLEPEVCRLAAQKASPKALKEMQDLIDSYALVKERDELDPLYAKFHRLVGRACGNQIYSIIMENIMDFTESFIRTMKPVTTIIHNERDHDEIMEAFRQRDPDKAAEVGIRHAMDILNEMKMYPSAGYLLPQPGTPIYSFAIEKGLIKDEEEYRC